MLYLAVAVDCLHAFLMLVWVVGVPLLFWRRFRRLSVAYCLFSLVFIIINQVSSLTLGECIFTTIANWFYSQAGQNAPDEWFTVRLTRSVFGLIPTHRGIKLATEYFIAFSAIGGMYTIYKERQDVAR